MTTTYSAAVDSMFGLINTAWIDKSADIVGYGSVPNLYWQGNEPAEKPAKDKFWGRVSAQNVGERQTTLKTGIASNENRRYTSTGLLFIQIFCPMSDVQAMEKGRLLSEMVRNCFRGKEAGSVWFRNSRINELPPADDMYRFNIVVDYEYDSLG